MLAAPAHVPKIKLMEDMKYEDSIYMYIHVHDTDHSLDCYIDA